MSMKSKLIALTAMGLALGTTGYGRRSLMLNEETEQERKDRLAKAEIERNIRNGLKLFTYHNNGETVEIWALNQKNAERKYSNLQNKLWQE